MQDATTKIYEVSFLLGKEEDLEIVLKHLAAHKAEVATKSPLTQINLAYPIKKHDKAYFGFVRITMDPAEAPKLNDDMRLDNGIIRSLIIASPAEKSERRDPSQNRTRRAPAKEVSNEALEAKLAALQGGENK